MKNTLRTLPVILFGNFLMQLGIALFLLPGGLITGGTTGIALAVNHMCGLPIPAFVAIFNVAMFLLGWLFLGRAFAMTTLVSTMAAPVLLAVLQQLIGDLVLTADPMLCTLFGGACLGISIAMIVKMGASTGGMDIPPLLLKKFFGIPISVSLYAFDTVILLMQAFYSDREHLLYGILLVAVYTIMVDKVMTLGDRRLQLEIISEKYDEIRQAILSDVDRGVTLLHGQTGYRRQETDVVICVIAPRERHRTEQLIRRIDPDAFIILSQVTRVIGLVRSGAARSGSVRKAE